MPIETSTVTFGLNLDSAELQSLQSAHIELGLGVQIGSLMFEFSCIH